MIVPVIHVITASAKMASTVMTVFANLVSLVPNVMWKLMSVHQVPVGMEALVWMKRTDSTASVLRASSLPTVTLRWMSVAAALVSMAHAEMTSMVTVVIVSLAGLVRTVTWIETIACQVPARMLAHASTSSMDSPASAAKASEEISAKSTSTNVHPVPVLIRALV